MIINIIIVLIYNYIYTNTYL